MQSLTPWRSLVSVRSDVDADRTACIASSGSIENDTPHLDANLGRASVFSEGGRRWSAIGEQLVSGVLRGTPKTNGSAGARRARKARNRLRQDYLRAYCPAVINDLQCSMPVNNLSACQWLIMAVVRWPNCEGGHFESRRFISSMRPGSLWLHVQPPTRSISFPVDLRLSRSL
jgi:hypothetical protein